LTLFCGHVSNYEISFILWLVLYRHFPYTDSALHETGVADDVMAISRLMGYALMLNMLQTLTCKPINTGSHVNSTLEAALRE
jgi:hypothetical protein